MVADERAANPDPRPRDAVVITQGIMSTMFHEVTRQVSVQCQERGRVLFGVWRAYADVFSSLRAATDEEVARAQARADAVVGRVEAKGLAWDKEKAELLAQIEELQQRPTAAQLDATVAKAKRDGKIEFEKLLTASRQAFQADLDASRASDDALIRSLNEQVEQLKALLADKNQTIKALQSDIATLQKRPMAGAGAGPAIPSPSAFEPPAMVEVGIQTEGAEPTAMQATAPRKRRARATTHVESKPFEMKQSFRIMATAFADKVRSDALDDYGNKSRMLLQEFLLDWFNHRYGVPGLAEKSVERLKQSLSRYRKDSSYLDMFGRLWGLYDPLPQDEEKLFFDAFAFVTACARPRQTAWDYDGLLLRVALPLAMDTARRLFSKVLPKPAMISFLTLVQKKVCVSVGVAGRRSSGTRLAAAWALHCVCCAVLCRAVLCCAVLCLLCFVAGGAVWAPDGTIPGLGAPCGPVPHAVPHAAHVGRAGAEGTVCGGVRKVWRRVVGGRVGGVVPGAAAGRARRGRQSHVRRSDAVEQPRRHHTRRRGQGCRGPRFGGGP